MMAGERFHHLGDRKSSLGYEHCFWSTYWPSFLDNFGISSQEGDQNSCHMFWHAIVVFQGGKRFFYGCMGAFFSMWPQYSNMVRWESSKTEFRKDPKTGESQTDDVLPMSNNGECMRAYLEESSTQPQDDIFPSIFHLTWISKFGIPTLERTWSWVELLIGLGGPVLKGQLIVRTWNKTQGSWRVLP